MRFCIINFEFCITFVVAYYTGLTGFDSRICR